MPYAPPGYLHLKVNFGCKFFKKMALLGRGWNLGMGLAALAGVGSVLHLEQKARHLEAYVRKLEDEMEKLRELHKAAVQGNESIKERLNEAEMQKSEYAVSYEEALKDLLLKQLNILQLESEKKELKSALDHALGNLQRSEQRVVAADDQKRTLELSLQSALEKVEEKEGEFKALLAQKMQLESSLCGALEKMGEKERECEDLMVQNKRELQEKAELQREIERLVNQQNQTMLERGSKRIGSALDSRTNPTPGKIKKNPFGGISTTTKWKTAAKGIPPAPLGGAKVETSASTKEGKGKKLTNIKNAQTGQRWRANKPDPRLIQREKEATELERLINLQRERREKISARSNALAAVSPINGSSLPKNGRKEEEKFSARRNALAAVSPLKQPSLHENCLPPVSSRMSIASSLSSHAEATTELKNGIEKIKKDLMTYTNTYLGLQMGRSLGSGTFGTVHEADTRFNQKIAIKVLIADKLAGLSDYKLSNVMYKFYQEAYMLSNMYHPNIVRFEYIVSDVPGCGLPGIATELMSGGDLFNFIHKAGGLRSWNNIWTIANQVATGLWYLHSEKKVHFDVKSSNILMDFNGRIVCKVTDFGLALDNSSGEIPVSSQRGTLEYMAPEIIRTRQDGMQMVTDKVDVYSFGIMLWELIVGALPYDGMTDDKIESHVLTGGRPEEPDWCDIGWRALMKDCWSPDESQRPSFSDILDILSRLLGAP